MAVYMHVHTTYTGTYTPTRMDINIKIIQKNKAHNTQAVANTYVVNLVVHADDSYFGDHARHEMGDVRREVYWSYINTSST